MKLIFGAGLLAILLSIPAGLYATPLIEGRSIARDGQTLILQGRTIRLWGIVAPAPDQTCYTKRHKPFSCGHVATAALSTLVQHVTVSCRLTDRQNGPRTYRCRIGALDVAEQQVLQGWAFADRRTGAVYRRAERAAQLLNEGLWKGVFEFPWDWRNQRR